MFKKLAVFTDIHFGLKSNSKLHNDDCEEFVDWYIDLAKQHGCETGMFCGDWHHNRNSVNITTMDASIRSLEKIGKSNYKTLSSLFENVVKEYANEEENFNLFSNMSN